MSYQIEKREKGYILFTITRNEKRNAINYEVMHGLAEAIRLAGKEASKALVITGEGEKAFCSGGDLSIFQLLHTKEEAYPMLAKMADILYSIMTLPVPTIALINGTVLGGGMELASACDFRLAKKGIKAGFVQGKQAITTGWGGGSILAEKLPHSVAMKILMEAELQTAEFFYDIGFFNALYEGSPIFSCESFLGKLLLTDQAVLEAYKKIWVRKWTESNLRDRIEAEVKNCAWLWESDAHHSYVTAFINKNR
ncbi:enoyl-CoA hydratase/isomerase family protein [Neobacillus dielmonensis]|uniref:enoyl-CoA hydratase/isomerase family protein n=1 Tax=Neobacillus dielmonensis TaxID=1347369 RepID=UPI0005A88861|nr:enoyl-CoA hydratase/isomerase family protein [Neobacillus dielmonensis]